MNTTFKQTLCLVPLLLVTACADFVQLKPGADIVNIYTIDNVSDCAWLGSVQVSVMSKLGPIDRDALTVENELNTLARNSAFASGGDAAMPIGPVKDGARDFNVYKCKK